ncbi:hypothetical protein CASFOL_017389 [Castilleja foliolosa]|uniref:RRM domain-containing protein n=1 Tax=Castilleja foliolosa TaxID=1961234 RepID=A0ABD3DF43_9LAMI
MATWANEKRKVMRLPAVVDVEGFSPSRCGGVWLPDGDDSLVGGKVCRRWQAVVERKVEGATEYNLFVGSLNKQATEKEVEEIFSPNGRVDEVYLMRDELKQSHGI